MYLTNDEASDTDKEDKETEDYGLYESIPEDSNFIMQADMIGFAQDQVTKDVANEVHYEYMNESEEWYNETLNETINDIDSGADEELPSDINFSITDINNSMVFMSYDRNDLENITNNSYTDNMYMDTTDNINDTNYTDYKLGFIGDIELSEDELQTIIEEGYNNSEYNNTNITEEEYNDYTIYKQESNNTVDDTYIVILEDGIIAVSNNEEYMYDIIETHNGNKEYVNKDIIPNNSSDTYFTFSLDDADIIYDEYMNTIEDIEDSIYYDELSEEQKQEYKDYQDIPTPQSIVVSYTTENDELKLNTKVTFDTLEAASKFNREFDNTDDNTNISTDITLDKTTVHIQQKTTSDVVIDNINTLIDEYGQWMGTTNEYNDSETSIESEIYIDKSGNNVNMTVIDTGMYQEFYVMNPSGESIGIINQSNNWTNTYPKLDSGNYTVLGVSSDGLAQTEIQGTYTPAELYIDDILDSDYDATGTVEIFDMDDEIEVVIMNNEIFDEFTVVDSNNTEQTIGSEEGDRIVLPDGEYTVKGYMEDGTEDIIKRINTTEDNIEDSDTNTTEEDVQNTTTVTEEDIDDEDMIEITIEENDYVEEFRVIDPEGISYEMDSEIGTTKQYPKYDDASYTVVGIMEDGSEQIIETVSE